MISGITRVRLEATDLTEDGVKVRLLAAWTALKEHSSGEWEIEGEITQTTKNGYWGYLTVRRKTDGKN